MRGKNKGRKTENEGKGEKNGWLKTGGVRMSVGVGA